MKKFLCLFLSLILTFSFVQMYVSAAEKVTDIPFSYTVYSDKESYEKGEDVNIRVSAKNTTLDKITDIRLWMDYPTTDYYLTPGITEHFIESCTESINEKFRVSEDENVLETAAKINSVININDFLLKLAHAYKSLTLFYTTIRYRIQNFFVPLRQNELTLGSVKVLYDNTEIEFTVKCRYSVKKSVKNTATVLSNDNGLASADIKAVDNSYTGLIFGADNNNNSYGLFAINPDYGKAFIYKVDNNKYNLVSVKSVDIEADKSYRMKVYSDGSEIKCFLFDNPYDTDPYPIFDIYLETDGTGCGAYTSENGYTDFKVSDYEEKMSDKTYTNPVYENSPDPFILKDNGQYYLYATTNPGDGYSVSTSTDLVNWQSLGRCALKGDIYGESDFWAPEVYNYNGRYYMLYSTDEHLALAVADSPAGPFKKTKDGYLMDIKCIDGDIFFDDDGSIYLYMAYWGDTGEEIWGCKLNSDLSVIPDTMTQLTSCKDDEGGVNEGPFMLKYEGKYYLTYSVNGYTDQNYAVKLAVSDSPLGTYNSKGTILEKSGPLVGTGHHSFTTSPDGTELIIAYHCHYSTNTVHARKLCIDRCKFVKDTDGYTISVCGPTSTPQPYPAAD